MRNNLNRYRLIESEEGSHASIRCENLRDASGLVAILSARFSRRAALAPVTDDRHSLPWRTCYPYGEGLARILTRALNLPVTARATEGPGQNILLLEAGEIQIGFVTLGVALQGWNGSAPWTGGKQLRTMRALFPMYDTPFQFMVREESGIR